MPANPTPEAFAALCGQLGRTMPLPAGETFLETLAVEPEVIDLRDSLDGPVARLIASHQGVPTP